MMMNKARLVISILFFSGFVVFAGSMIWNQWNSKRKAFKESFNGMVISTMEQKRNENYTTRITVEIAEKGWKCLISISPIKPGALYPRYQDSLFKEANSDEIYLKRGQEGIFLLEGISCLGIEHKVKKIRDP